MAGASNTSAPATAPMRSVAWLAVAFVPFLAAPLVLSGNYHYGVAHQALVFVLLATGYNILLGLTGMVSLGHVALFAIGAYTSAILQTSLDWPFLACLAAAGVVTGAFGTLIAIPALRIKGHYLTLLTLALGEVIRLLIRNFDWLTNGSSGLGGISRPSIFGIPFRSAPDLYWLLLAMAAAGVLFAWRLEGSRFGRAFKAIRDSEIGAEVIGIDTARMKVLSFAISAVYAGLAGSLYAHTMRFVSPEFFSLGLTITLLAMVLIGGRGLILGPVIGATLLTVAPEALRFAKEYYLVGFGLMIWLCMLYLPEGIAGKLARIVARLRPPRRTAPEAPPATTPAVRAGSDRRRPEQDVPPLLEVRDIEVRFGGLKALDGVGFDVRPAEILGLVGPNGSGKSTLLNVLSGVYVPSRGSVMLDGQRIDGRRSSRIARDGLGRTFQNLQIFQGLSLVENVLAGFHHRQRSGVLSTVLGLPWARREQQAARAQALRLLERVGLGGRGEEAPSTLSYGQRRLLEVARALATGPRILMLDEPCAGLSQGEADQLADLVRDLAAEGMAVIVIEHNMRFVMALVDRMVVLNFGRRIAEGAPADIRANEDVVAAYLGKARHAHG